MAKICEQCGREFEDRSVRCPICKLDLVSIEGGSNRAEQQRMQKARQARQARYAQGMRDRQGRSAQERNTQTQGGQARRQAQSVRTWGTQAGQAQVQHAQGVTPTPQQSNGSDAGTSRTGSREATHERTMHASATKTKSEAQIKAGGVTPKIIIFGDGISFPLYISVDGHRELTIRGKRPRYINLTEGTHHITVTTISKSERILASGASEASGESLASWTSASAVKSFYKNNTSLAGDLYFGKDDVLLFKRRTGIIKSYIDQMMIKFSEMDKYVDVNAAREIKQTIPWKKWGIVLLCLLYLGCKEGPSPQPANKTSQNSHSEEKNGSSVAPDGSVAGNDALIASNAPDVDRNRRGDYQDLEESSIRASYALDTETTAEDGSGYILPGSDSRYLAWSDLEGLSKEECRLARNELYARHGRRFNDTDLANYFSQFDWYQPTMDPDSFDDSMLNVFEIANRDLIVRFEEEQGYR